MAAISVSAIQYFLPVFAFLLVFIVVYALLKKTQVIGGSEGIMLFISLILASFFVIESSLVDFVILSSSWVSVLIIIVFFIVALLGFMPWKEPFGFLTKRNWFAWVLLAAVLGIFIVSSAYVFHWAISWGEFNEWINTDWFGMILLLVIAGIVALIIKGKAK